MRNGAKLEEKLAKKAALSKWNQKVQRSRFLRLQMHSLQRNTRHRLIQAMIIKWRNALRKKQLSVERAEVSVTHEMLIELLAIYLANISHSNETKQKIGVKWIL